MRRRHARFRGDSLGGEMREGSGDALAGASLEGAAPEANSGSARAAPVWGRGLMLGDPREPWSRHSRPGRRRARGDVAWYRGGGRRLRVGALSGGIAGGTHGGFDLAAGAIGLGVAGDRAGMRRAGVWWLREQGRACAPGNCRRSRGTVARRGRRRRTGGSGARLGMGARGPRRAAPGRRSAARGTGARARAARRHRAAGCIAAPRGTADVGAGGAVEVRRRAPWRAGDA